MSSFRDVIRLEVDPARIALRQLATEDVSDAYVSWLNDPVVNAYLEARHDCPHTIDSVRDFVANCIETRRCHWGVFYDDTHVGNVTSTVNQLYRYASVANVVGDARFRGTHLAKYALSGALDFLFGRMDMHRVEAGTYASHLTGIALLTSLGFVKEAVYRERIMIEGEFIDSLWFSLLEQEWRSCKASMPHIEVSPPPWLL